MEAGLGLRSPTPVNKQVQNLLKAERQLLFSVTQRYILRECSNIVPQTCHKYTGLR